MTTGKTGSKAERCSWGPDDGLQITAMISYEIATLAVRLGVVTILTLRDVTSGEAVPMVNKKKYEYYVSFFKL